MSLGLHHVHRRRRSDARLSAFDFIMYGVGILQPMALLPQIFSIYIEGSKQGVSLTTWLILTVFNALWAIYGYVHKATPVLIGNVLLTILDIAIVYGVLYY